jgi:hypothetical protein
LASAQLAAAADAEVDASAHNTRKDTVS